MFSRRLAFVGIILVVLILGSVPLAAFAQDSLSEQYVSPSGSLTFSYPAGWVTVEDQGLISLTNDEAALEEDMVPPGAVGVLIVDPAMLRMVVYDLPDTSPQGVVAALAEAISFGEIGVNAISVPESFSLEGRDAARLSFALELGEMLMIAIDAGDGTVIAVVAVTAPGGMAQFEADILAIVATIEYTPAWHAALYGHEDWVNGVTFSTDSAQVISASDDGTVRVWDVESGVELLTLEHPDYVRDVAYHPSEALLASACDDGTVRVWDAITGDEKLAIEAHDDYVYSVAFSPDGSRLASGSSDALVKVWDVVTGEHLLTLEGEWYTVKDVAFSPDGTLIATAGDDSTARVWDAQTGAVLLSIEHPDWTRSVAFSPDGVLLVTGSDDGIVRVWKAASGEAVAELSGHTDYVRAVAVSPDGTLIASGSDDSTVRVWQLEADGSFSEKAVLSGHADWVKAVAFSPDGSLIASGGDDGAVLIWDVPR
ncbi:MAG: WD40 repeat domain-containing protein [Anaerolineae bacterium]|nr:WD40 repeat domain-containing protein [Anaerolineae bacterium]